MNPILEEIEDRKVELNASIVSRSIAIDRINYELAKAYEIRRMWNEAPKPDDLLCVLEAIATVSRGISLLDYFGEDVRELRADEKAIFLKQRLKS